MVHRGYFWYPDAPDFSRPRAAPGLFVSLEHRSLAAHRPGDSLFEGALGFHRISHFAAGRHVVSAWIKRRLDAVDFAGWIRREYHSGLR